MDSVIRWIIRRRFLVLAGVVLATGAFGAIASQGRFASSLANLLLGENPEYGVYKERIREFANDEAFFIAYEDPDPLSPGSLKRLRAVIRKVKKLPDVGHVQSLLNTQQITSDGDALVLEKYTRMALKHPDRRAEILKRLQEDPLVSGLLLSGDGRHAIVVIELVPASDRPAERGPILVEEVTRIFVDGGFERDKIHRVGLLATVAEVMTQTQYNITRLFPLVCVVLMLILYLMFNRLWPVFITMVVAFVADVWCFGFSVLLDENINIMVAMVPSVIMIVATSDVIHLCSAYMLELAQGRDKGDAIVQSGKEVGTACLMTSATTFVGFVSLSVVPVPMFRQMGLVLGFGVAVALLLAITLAPILFSLMRAPRPWSDEVSGVQRWLSRALGGIERATLRRSRSVVILFALVLGVSVFGITQLEFETDLAKRMDEDNPVRVDERYYDEHFVGSNFLEVFIDTPEEDGLLDPGLFARVRTFQEKVEKFPEVDKVVSVVDLIETIDEELNTDQVPMSRALLSQYLEFFQMGGGEDLERMVDFERKSMRMAVRLPDNAVRATHATGHKVRALGEEVLGQGARVVSSGMTYLLGGFLDSIIDGQRMGLLLAFAVIMVMMVVWLRSLRVGLLSMIPNLLPILALAGLLGLRWDSIDSDAIGVAMIAVGIGVDDTIHFLVRLKFESQRAGDTVRALKRTFHFTGRAIIITTVILAVGFAPFAISDYFSINMFGTLIPFTMIVALLADILLVPAMAKLGWIRFGSTSTST